MRWSLEHITALVDAAYRKTRAHGRSGPRPLGYEMREERLTGDIARQLYHRKWRPAPLLWFVIGGPPVREVFTSPFADAAVNMVLFNILSPIAERRFIFDTYSCREGKGTLFGISRYEGHLRSVTQSWSRPAYVLSFDISGFFMSIRRLLLFDMIIDMLKDFQRRFPEAIDYEFTTWLLETTLLRDPLEGCHHVGDPALVHLVPPEKSIRFQPRDTGLTIGAVDHQLDSTIYLTPLDNLVKRGLRIHGYSRYVDDGRLVHGSYAYLEGARREITDFVADYGLRIHPDKTRIADAYEGTTFLGAHILPYRMHARTAIARRFARALDDLDTQLATDPDLDLKVALGPLNSRLGYMAQYDQRAAVRRVLERCPFVLKYYRFREDLTTAMIRMPDDAAATEWPLWTIREKIDESEPFDPEYLQLAQPPNPQEHDHL